MKKWIVRIIAITPAYPHWLEFRKSVELRQQLISVLYGSVIEVGAGDGSLKRVALATNDSISKYVASDYYSWDSAFEEGNRLAQSKGFIDQLQLRNNRNKLDNICSALDLPYSDESFDWHVSMEVLEHISDPYKFFSEAARVVKKNGGIVLTAPFLYRIHPNMTSDFFRILPGGYAAIAEKYGLKVDQVIANTGVGASCAALINQKFIRIYEEKKLSALSRVVLIILMPIVFFISNLCGLLLDGKSPDGRFASRFLIVMRK
jgi:ubiquinone/menaquinone biosynthesis C-methylase UbiE